MLGGALLAATIGPWAATITMTAILLVQALVFQDGGVLALAANVFNMAVLGVWAAWLPFRALEKIGHGRAGLFVGAFLSVTLSAALALAQVGASSDAVTPSLLLFCAGLFAITGLIEGAVSVAAWEAIQRLEGKSSAKKAVWPLVLAAAAVMLAGVFFASQAPDVLEVFSQKTGLDTRVVTVLPGLMPDYEWQSLPVDWLRKAGAGVAGLLLLFAISTLLARAVPARAQE